MSTASVAWTEEAKRAARALPLFEHLAEETFATLISVSALITAEAGKKVLDREKAPEGFTFLLQGKWTMHRHVPGGTTPVVWTDDRPGSWHGGVAPVDAIAPADVWADLPSRLMFVPTSVMLPLLRTEPYLAHHILRGLHGGAELLWTSLQSQRPNQKSRCAART